MLYENKITCADINLVNIYNTLNQAYNNLYNIRMTLKILYNYFYLHCLKDLKYIIL